MIQIFNLSCNLGHILMCKIDVSRQLPRSVPDLVVSGSSLINISFFKSTY